MPKIDMSTVHVVGDSLQACIASYSLSLVSSRVIHHTTGRLGGINYDKDGYPVYSMLPITEDIKNILIGMGISNEDFIGPLIARYIHIPYDKLKIKNKSNGDISWPFNRDSFDSNEWNSIVYSMKDYISMIEESNKTRNAPAVLRRRLPINFYNSVVKRMGVNLLCSPHGQIEPTALIESVLRLDNIYNDRPEPFYICKYGITKICDKLLDRGNIKIVSENIGTTRMSIRNRDKLFYIVDRHDYFLDFIAGGIDYVTYKSDDSTVNTDEDYTIRYTPHEDHSIEYVHNHKMYKIRSSVAKSSDNDVPCMQIPTMKTVKAMEEYREVAKVTPSIRII